MYNPTKLEKKNILETTINSKISDKELSDSCIKIFRKMSQEMKTKTLLTLMKDEDLII